MSEGISFMKLGGYKEGYNRYTLRMLTDMQYILICNPIHCP